MDWMLPELINTLSRDIKVTPVSHGDHNLAQQRLGVECMWWIARAKKSRLIRRHDTVRKVNPNWKKCLSILTTPVAWFTAWTCAFENRAGVNQCTWMPHRWILGLHGSSAASHHLVPMSLGESAKKQGKVCQHNDFELFPPNTALDL